MPVCSPKDIKRKFCPLAGKGFKQQQLLTTSAASSTIMIRRSISVQHGSHFMYLQGVVEIIYLVTEPIFINGEKYHIYTGDD